MTPCTTRLIAPVGITTSPWCVTTTGRRRIRAIPAAMSASVDGEWMCNMSCCSINRPRAIGKLGINIALLSRPTTGSRTTRTPAITSSRDSARSCCDVNTVT